MMVSKGGLGLWTGEETALFVVVVGVPFMTVGEGRGGWEELPSGMGGDRGDFGWLLV